MSNQSPSEIVVQADRFALRRNSLFVLFNQSELLASISREGDGIVRVDGNSIRTLINARLVQLQTSLFDNGDGVVSPQEARFQQFDVSQLSWINEGVRALNSRAAASAWCRG